MPRTKRAPSMRPAPTLPMTDPHNALGQALAAQFRLHALALRATSVIVTNEARKNIARDLDVLAWIAEHRPEVLAEACKRTETKE